MEAAAGAGLGAVTGAKEARAARREVGFEDEEETKPVTDETTTDTTETTAPPVDEETDLLGSLNLQEDITDVEDTTDTTEDVPDVPDTTDTTEDIPELGGTTDAGAGTGDSESTQAGQPPSGEGVSVAGQPDAGAPTEGAGAVEPTRVVPPAEDAGRTDVREAEQPPAITETTAKEQPLTITETTTEQGAPVGTQTTQAVEAKAQGQEQRQEQAPDVTAPTRTTDTRAARTQALQEQIAAAAAERSDEVTGGRAEPLPKRKPMTAEQRKQRLAEIKATEDEIGALYEEELTVDNPDNLPATWNKLSRDRKDVYLDNLATNSAEGHANARRALKDYTDRIREVQKEDTGKSGETKAAPYASVYERNRETYGRRDGVEYPAWNDLTVEERQAFIRAYEDANAKPGTRKDTADVQDAGFTNVRKSLEESGAIKRERQSDIDRREAERKVSEAKTYAERQKQIAEETEQKKKAEEQRALREQTEERKKRDRFMDEEASKQLQQKNLQGVLQQLRTKAKNPALKQVAQFLFGLKLKTKIEIVDSLPKDRIAQYDPKTDTIQVTAEGMTEHTVLHEVVHAAAVSVIDKYTKQKGKGLTQEQLDGVEQLRDIMEATRERLGERFPDAYKNLHEFVSYALTDINLQEELARTPAMDESTVLPESYGTSKWPKFVKAVFKALGLTDFVNAIEKKGVRSSLAEVLAAFEMIAIAPTERIEMAPLPAKVQGKPQRGKRKKAPEFTAAKDGEEALNRAYERRTQNKPNAKKAIKGFVRAKRPALSVVKKLVNSKIFVRDWELNLDRAGKIIYDGAKQNAVYNAIIRAAGIGKDQYLSKVERPAMKLMNAIASYADKRGISVEKAEIELQEYVTALHAPERRHTFYLLRVPLSDKVQSIKLPNGKTVKTSPASLRKAIFKKTQEGKAISESLAKEYRDILEMLADKKNGYVDPLGFSGVGVDSEGIKAVDENDDAFRPIDAEQDANAAKVKQYVESLGLDKELQDVRDAMKKLIDTTVSLNRDSNYYSIPVQNIVRMYGWENYVPLKGRTKREKGLAGMLDYESVARVNDAMQEVQAPAGGRNTLADSPLMQVIADATDAAMRYGRREITLSLVNAVKQGLIPSKAKKDPKTGEPQLEKIAFEARYEYGVEKGRDKIFHYEPDGTITVVDIANNDLLEAIKGAYKPQTALEQGLDKVGTVTSFIGSMHTRYNPSFASMNFLRDMLTNSFNIASKYGPMAGAKYIGSIAAQVTPSRIGKAWRVAYAYERGDFATIKRLAASKDGQFVKDMMDYIDLGGKVSYMQSITKAKDRDEMIKTLRGGPLADTKKFINLFFDTWIDGFELSSRVAAYRVTKSKFLQEGSDQGAAKKKAVGFVKDLANFEQAGDWGKNLGSLWMFFRPSATGAYRAVEAVTPMFQSWDFIKGTLPETITNDPAALKKYKATFNKEKQNASITTVALGGLGVALYTISRSYADDDDQGRNLVDTDDPARWSRYARFFIPKWLTDSLGMEPIDKPFQLPWGFGLGGFAAIGAQAAALAHGNASLEDAAINSMLIGMDSFVPVPVSKISPTDDPVAWLLDSISPSILRPAIEYKMNMDTFGRRIYNNRPSRYADAYIGRDNIPEIYNDAARWIYDNTSFDPEPAALYFMVNNYADAIGRMVHTTDNLYLISQGEKAFNPKTDTVLFDSFFGAPPNIDGKDFAEARREILKIAARLATYEAQDPKRYADYLKKNPSAQALVDTYNKEVNGYLRDLQTQANIYRRMPGLTAKERQEHVKSMVDVQNIVKRNILNILKAYKED
jgi:hypothetical protein